MRHFYRLVSNSEVSETRRVAPKSWLRYDKFDRNLRLTQKCWAQTDDSAEHFLSKAWILNADNLLKLYSGPKKYQRSMIAHNYGVCLF